MEKVRKVHRSLVRKPERKRPLGRPRHKLGYNIKIILNIIGCEVKE